MSASSPLRIGYSTLRDQPTGPGDRRRFVRYAQQRGLEWEIARPGREYDVVVTSVGGDLSTWLRLPQRTRLVLDMVDSYLADPGFDMRAALRGVFKYVAGHTRHLHIDFRKLLADCLKRADAVICSTEEQAAGIREHCSNVHTILDIQSEAVRQPKLDYARGERLQLVWEGMALNLHTFRAVAAPLRQFAARHPLTLHLVTDLECPRGSTYLWKRPTRDVVREVIGLDDVVLHEWEPERVSQVASACDLALIPIPLDVSFLRGKPENKLLLFWRLGVPALASRTPSYERVMRRVGLDLSCGSAEEWLKLLELLAGDEALRRDAGERGRAFAELEYGEPVLLARWDGVFQSLGVETSHGREGRRA